MIKRLLVTFCLFLTFSSFAQESSASPYSYYGVGEIRFKGTADTRAMGSIAVLPDSIHINMQNPAFYTNLKLTGLTLGGSHTKTRLETNTEEEKARRTSFDYLAIGIPMGKLGAGFGLMPYSAVGYKIENTPTLALPQLRQYTGNGGVNKAFLGAGYQITKKLSVGAEFGYYFGDIETTSLTRVADAQYGTREQNESHASGAGFTAGFSYITKISNKLQFNASATFAPESKLTFRNERRIDIVQFLSSGLGVLGESYTPDADNTKVKLPTKVLFGAGIGEPKKWMVGTQLTLSQSEDMGNRFGDIENSQYENGFVYSLGGYYIPNYASFSDYTKKIAYRAGFRYEDTGLVINGKDIKDTAVTFGLGLPLGGSFSNINVGVEYGKRGTKDAMLVEENYLTFTLGLSFNDRWFVKRKYD
jgi:hypothetical protein